MTTADACPDCTGDLAREGDETICADCGLVVDADRLDRGPEWRSFADDDTNRERTGAPLTRSRHDRGLSTEIGSSRSVRATGRKRRQLGRLRREHRRARIPTKRDRNEVYSFTEIHRIAGRLELPEDLIEQACTLFDSAQSADLLQGRSLEGFAAAAIYATCRTRSLSRTVDEIVAVARADAGELRAAYDALNRELGLPTGPIDPGEYVPRFASQLDAPDAVERRALALVAAARDAAVTGGRDPSGVAAGCLYAAARECCCGLTQAAVADVAGVSPVTLRKAFHDVRELEVENDDGALDVEPTRAGGTADGDRGSQDSGTDRVPSSDASTDADETAPARLRADGGQRHSGDGGRRTPEGTDREH